jgi:hypothetical protein
MVMEEAAVLVKIVTAWILGLAERDTNSTQSLQEALMRMTTNGILCVGCTAFSYQQIKAEERWWALMPM